MNARESSGTAARALGAIGLAGVAVFALVCGAAQVMRADLDWIAAPLSYYLTGAYGDGVIAAYLGLSVGLAAIGLGFRRALHGRARSAAPLLLFLVAAIALALTALSEKAKLHDASGAWALVHLLAAQTTFLCVTVAMLLQSWRVRYDMSWRPRSTPMLALAVLAFAALWLHVLARGLPRGASQKIVIVLILAWLAWASYRLWHAPRERRTPSFPPPR
ncbi:DUF998 domain-containing protein [Dokdonella sp.]|uniref:DUF998 domain-containing protein n=1 Tax=Dokdonella sp. TaxID=2291710 RepID=UPI001B0D12D5|nr:DUF998 domain-containing protein [Dokdonella sp.]MBO9663140.1 DUF998 domain-containing protein [Dokdonella sp.]